MHVAAESFAPEGALRPAWTDPIFDVFQGAETSDPALFQRVEEVRAACTAHDAGGTGLLIHQDAHLSNLHITDDGRISLFDFDDCAYGTPTHDIAIVLFCWLLGRDEDQHPAARRFVAHFMRGYERHTSLRAGWHEGADRFMTFREVDIYWLVKDESPPDVTPLEKRFMEGRRERIFDGVPYLGSPLADVL